MWAGENGLVDAEHEEHAVAQIIDHPVEKSPGLEREQVEQVVLAAHQSLSAIPSAVLVGEQLQLLPRLRHYLRHIDLAGRKLGTLEVVQTDKRRTETLPNWT